MDQESEAKRRGLTVRQLLALAWALEHGTPVSSLYLATERSLAKRGLMDDDRMPTQAARDLLDGFWVEPQAADGWNPADGVQYSHCRHCQALISRADHGADWIERRPGGVTYTECRKSPATDADVMGLHEPGTIVSPPKPQPESALVPDLSALPAPVIPWIPKTEA